MKIEAVHMCMHGINYFFFLGVKFRLKKTTIAFDKFHFLSRCFFTVHEL